MIFRPVTPQSAQGPPSAKLPEGLTMYSMPGRCQPSSARGASVSRTYAAISPWSLPFSCMVETRTVFTSTGRPPS